MKARWQPFFWVLTPIVLSLGIAPRILPERLQMYGDVQVGKLLPERVRSEHEQSSSNTSNKFISYYFPRSADTECDCTRVKESVASRGGRLEIMDSKISKYFGVPLIHDGVGYQHADSLLITVSATGKVISIHRGISTAHLVLGLATPGWIGRGSDTMVYGWNKAVAKIAAVVGYAG
ncbi:MAG: hypothetical protein NTY08_03180 [Proteobacteria bacterium]|nr:hypothetical protein [Pseudomonadota bacterium]